MHRGASQDFERAGAMLEALTQRARRQAVAPAWLAKWPSAVQSRPHDGQAAEAKIALDSPRALDAEPNCSLALTIDGFVHTNLLKRLDIGQQRYELALHVNPNDSLAWLSRDAACIQGGGQLARGRDRARTDVVPTDPLRYFYESLAATAAHSAGHYDAPSSSRSVVRAIACILRLPSLAIAQSRSGRMEKIAQDRHGPAQDPAGSTVRRYWKATRALVRYRRAWAEALQRAGVPRSLQPQRRMPGRT